MSVLLSAENLAFSYRSHRAVQDVVAQVRAGEVVSVIGPNGSGKSTLLRCLIGLLRPDIGRVRLLGRNVREIQPRERARLIGYVPQMSYQEQPFTVTDAVLMGRRPHSGWRFRPEDLRIAERVMEQLRITHLADRFIGELSGGQRQKVFIGRALAQEPQLLALDEPISALDVYHQLEVLELVREQALNHGAGVLMVLHDLSLAHRFSDRVLLLQNGHLQDSGSPADVISHSNIADVYRVDIDLHPTAHGALVQPINCHDLDSPLFAKEIS